MTHKNERVLSVAELARVEGEGALYIRTAGDRVVQARLDIYEPPRFFEAFLRGRGYAEPPDITARICGICPVAYQMSACAAIEDACGVTVPAPVGDLRRLLYCGEWIESHALHIYLLHAPDFLGYGSGIEMAAARRDLVERGLALKKAGNAIMEAVGGRAIHPVNVRLGGFYRAPAKAELTALAEPLKRALGIALETVRWVAGFAFPDHAVDPDPAGHVRHRAGHVRHPFGIELPLARVRRARDRGAHPALDRAARSPGRRRPVPHRSAGQVRARLPLAVAAGPGGRARRRARRDLRQPVPQDRK